MEAEFSNLWKSSAEDHSISPGILAFFQHVKVDMNEAFLTHLSLGTLDSIKDLVLSL